MASPAEARQALIDNPPPKCPYFTLPDVRHFPKETRVSKARKKTGYVSIVALWGPAGKMKEESTTEFLLHMLKHWKGEPDFEAIAADWQLNGTSYIKSRFKSIVEGQGFKLVGESKVVDGEGLPKPATTPPSKKVKTKKQKAPDRGVDEDATTATKASRTKKRKATDGAEVSKPKPTKKRKQNEKAAVAEREPSPATEPPQDATGVEVVRGSASPEASAREPRVERLEPEEEMNLETQE